MDHSTPTDLHRPTPSGHGLENRFAARYASVAAHEGDGLIRDDWRRRNDELREHLLPVPPPDFLRHPVIRYQMFVDERHLQGELPFVERRLPALDLASEDVVGDPPTTQLYGVTSSSNTVHHLHHLLRYEAETDRRISDLDTVVEWGGGYGNVAKLFTRLHGGEPTYVVVDTPLFSAVQWLYLGTVLGEDRVALHADPGTDVVPGVVNLVPCGLAEHLSVAADMFVSTWALNESTNRAQHLVLDRSWFGAEALLLGMHEGDPLQAIAHDAGARSSVVTETMPLQRYVVH